MKVPVTKHITFSDSRETMNVFGNNDDHLRLIEDKFNIDVASRGTKLTLHGRKQDVELVEKLVNDLRTIHASGEILHLDNVLRLMNLRKEEEKHGTGYSTAKDVIPVPSKKLHIRPKTLGQKKYVDAIKRSDITFAIGPAGTGKTYIAVALAVSMMQAEEVSRIILTRPAVEAGEKLGFLPGSLQEKVNPYLRPLYDAMYDMMDFDRVHELLTKDIIEVAPLAYMRGRTLNSAFIILDEAQNTTPEQLKMFVTRLGFGSKAVITGDVTQVDLPKDKMSGLEQAEDILKGVKGISFVELSGKDAVRHEVVARIIEAYSDNDNKK